MTIIAIRTALESALDAMTPALATAWENVEFTPTPGTEYQRASLLFAMPDDSEIQGRAVERGIFQVDLLYPINNGTGDVAARAELLRQTFYPGRSLVSGATTVTIQKTPDIAPAHVDGDRYFVPVSIRFSAPI